MIDPRDEARRLIGQQIALAETVATRGAEVDPAEPTKHMRASEARLWHRNAEAIKAAEAQIPQTMSPAALLALL